MGRVLIVEVHPHVRRRLARILEGDGHRVACAATRRQALAISGAFDCVILDAEQQGEDGTPFAEELLKLGRTSSIVFHSATADPWIIDRAVRLGPLVKKGSRVGDFLATVGASLVPQAAAG